MCECGRFVKVVEKGGKGMAADPLAELKALTRDADRALNMYQQFASLPFGAVAILRRLAALARAVGTMTSEALIGPDDGDDAPAFNDGVETFRAALLRAMEVKDGD